jgi:hypothetical protein
MSDSEEMEEIDVPPGFVPPPPAEPPAKTNCVKCTKEWDLKDEAHRAKVVYVDYDGLPNLHCCACVPAPAASTVIEFLAGDRYKWEALANALLAEKQKLLHVQEEKQADLQIARAKLKKAFQQYQNIKQATSEERKQLTEERKQLTEERKQLTRALSRVRDVLDVGMKKAMRSKNPTQKQKLLLSTCCKSYSGARHRLRRQALNGLSGVFKPAALTEIDSVHPISLNVDKNGRESLVFCTVCRGFHGVGSDELDEHSPKLSIIELTGDATEDATALKALAVPFNAQPVSMQTNGLAESD